MSNYVPAQTTPFVGREQELADIAALLNESGCRLITILGPGGIGKTRFAIEVARRAEDRFADHVAYADLATLADNLYLPETIAQAVGLQLVGDSAAGQLVDYLSDKHLLLLLDNFEHLLEGAALVSDILRAAPRVQCLATSRQVLSLHEEWLFPLPGLRFLHGEADVHAAESEAIREVEAVELFMQRARRVRHDFDEEADLAAVARICQLVEGMPLAIELAASWTRVLSADAIAGQIEQGLDLLAADIRNVPERHRSIHAALAQSWARMDEHEQTVFAQLSVFRGGFRQDAAECVTGATLSDLARLADLSLLRWKPDGRYTMHELIRHYGAERLAENPDLLEETRQRHCTVYATFLHERRESVFGPHQYETLEEIRPELGNVRVAMRWGLEYAELATIDRLVYTYYWYCDIRGHFRENADAIERAIARVSGAEQTGTAPGTLASFCAYLSWSCIRLGELDKAIAYGVRSEEVLSKHRLEPARVFSSDPMASMGLAYRVLGEYDRALACAEESRRRSQALGDEVNLMVADYVLCSVCRAVDELDVARACGLEALKLLEKTGNSWFLGYVLMELGDVALAQENLADARRYFQRSFELKEGAVDPEGMAVALNHLGQIALLEGDHRVADELYARSLRLYQRVSDPGGRATTLHGLANTAAARGDIQAAVALYVETLDILESITYWPQALLVLADAAALLSEAGRTSAATKLLHAVGNHPSTEASTRRYVSTLLRDVGATVEAVGPHDSDVTRSDLSRWIELTQEWLAAAAEGAEVSDLPLDSVAAANRMLIEPLTPRELDVLQLIADGHTNHQIAEQLILSVGTVKYYSSQIYGKLAVSNRTQAVNQAREMGLLR